MAWRIMRTGPATDNLHCRFGFRPQHPWPQLIFAMLAYIPTSTGCFGASLPAQPASLDSYMVRNTYCPCTVKFMASSLFDPAFFWGKICTHRAVPA